MKPTDLQNNLVVKSNELITASYSMTVNEQRLLLACIGQIDSRTKIENGAVFRLSVEQARDLFYTKGDQRHAYRDMQDACERLFERKVRIALPEKQELLTRFVQSIVFDPENGTADLRFAYEILPYLSQLEANFTKYRLSNIVQLTSSHAVRIYELIVSWATQGQYYKEMEIDAFRELLGLGEKYKQNGQLRQFVTDKAVQQINESTDFELDINFRKSKRTFKWIQLRFNQKAAAKAADLEAKQQREARALHNQAAKQNREIREQDKAKAVAQTEAANYWQGLPDMTYFKHKDGSIWVKESDTLYCSERRSSIPTALVGAALASGEFEQIEKPEPKRQWWTDEERAEYEAKIDAKLVEVQKMPDGQLFQASDRTVYEKRGDEFYSLTRPDDKRPRSLHAAASCWAFDSWKPISEMPEPTGPSYIFEYYPTEADILADREKGINPLDNLTPTELNEVNDLIKEYQETKDKELYDFLVLLGIETPRPNLSSRIKNQK